jgi:hypothetical protein
MSFAIGRDQQSLAGMVFNTLPIAPVQCRLAFLHSHHVAVVADDDSDAQAAPFVCHVTGTCGAHWMRTPAGGAVSPAVRGRAFTLRAMLGPVSLSSSPTFGGTCRPRPAPAGAGFFFLSESHG